nr:hypothetical protein [Tanacetum cinerariifolium]
MLTFGRRGTSTQVLLLTSFIFVTHSLFPVRISQGMEWRLEDRGIGGGGGGVDVVCDDDGGGGVGVLCGDGVDDGVGGVVCGVFCRFVCGIVCGVVKEPISTMIVSVPEKDRWCGARGKFVMWKGVRVTKASKRAKVGVRGGGKDIK